MKTLTELSGSQVRAAAAAIDEAKRSLPAEPSPQPAAAPAAPVGEEAPGEQRAAAPAAPVSEGAPDEQQPDAPAPEGEETPDEQQADAPDAEEPAEAPAKPAAGFVVPGPVQEAVAKATGLSGDRLSMLCAAVQAAGGRVQDVRLVRVFGPEEPVPGAKTVGGHQYVVDLMPASMKQVAGSSREEGRRGGRGRGGGRGGGGGGGAGRGSGGGEKTGGFSMDSLREDRKNQRGGPGRFGGSRKPGGGGRPPGGAPRGR
jgi:translation initiation factor IF-2